ncbi:MAG: HEAT repeat domain-containing protein [Sedimentisphaerales bacterium]|nr:HEAT repeat domain-containing protein [Sedimentisphaerales bacterium]
MKAIKIILLLAFIVILSDSSSAQTRYGPRQDRGYYNYYPSSARTFGNYPPPWVHDRPPWWYRQYRPTRYNLPWDKPALEVSINYTDDYHLFYMPIPPIIVPEVPEKPRELVQTVGYDSRLNFLIDTVRHRTTQDRLLAVQELSEHKHISSVAVLVDTLFNDRSLDVRIAAAQSLSRINLPMAYLPLMRAAGHEEDEKIRTAARTAARHIRENSDEDLPNEISAPAITHGDQKMADCIEEYIHGKADIRERAVEKLSKYQSNRAVAVLVHALINDSDEEIRAEAAESLGKIGDSMAVPFLESSRDHDLEKSVRNAAQKALDKIDQND